MVFLVIQINQLLLIIIFKNKSIKIFSAGSSPNKVPTIAALNMHESVSLTAVRNDQNIQAEQNHSNLQCLCNISYDTYVCIANLNSFVQPVRFYHYHFYCSQYRPIKDVNQHIFYTSI